MITVRYVTERLLVRQQWYKTIPENLPFTTIQKNGCFTFGWYFDYDGETMPVNQWEVIQHLDYDKFGNPILGIAERIVKIEYELSKNK